MTHEENRRSAVRMIRGVPYALTIRAAAQPTQPANVVRSPKGGLLEGQDQLLKSSDPLIPADNLGVFACLARPRRNRHHLQGGNIIGKIAGVKHGRNVPNSVPIAFGI